MHEDLLKLSVSDMKYFFLPFFNKFPKMIMKSIDDSQTPMCEVHSFSWAPPSDHKKIQSFLRNLP